MLEIAAASAKFLLYAGACTAAGGAFAWATLDSALGEWTRRAPLVIRIGAVLAIVGALANVAILAMRLGGMFDEATLSAIRESPTGVAAALQMGGALALLAFASTRGLGVAARIAGGAALVASFAANGHAASADLVSAVIAFVHVAAAAWWLGALLLMMPACHAWTGEALVPLVRRFSQVALAVVANLVAAGVLLVLTLVDFAREGWFTPYAQLLTVKIALAAGVLALAVYNKFLLTPHLPDPEGRAVRALRLSIVLEVTFISAVLAVTAIMTTYTSPHN